MKGWRTLAINCGIAVFGVLEAADWSGLLGSERAGAIVTGIAIANMILRALTDTRVGEVGVTDGPGRAGNTRVPPGALVAWAGSFSSGSFARV